MSALSLAFMITYMVLYLFADAFQTPTAPNFTPEELDQFVAQARNTEGYRQIINVDLTGNEGARELGTTFFGMITRWL